MMKFIFLSLLICLSSFAGAKPLAHQEFRVLSLAQKIKIIEAYREFFRQMPTDKLSEAEKVSWLRSLVLIGMAQADGNFDCFYAGWPSKKVNGKCTNPSRGNPAYPAQAQACGAQQLLCQPVLFGPGLCAEIGTQTQRNSAYNQCESQFRSSGRSLESVAQTLSEGELAQAANDVFGSVESICRSGFQANTSMCSKLSARVAAIRAENPNHSTAQETSARQEVSAGAGVDSIPASQDSEDSVRVTSEGRTVTDPVARERLLGVAVGAEGLQDTVAGSARPDCDEDGNPLPRTGAGGVTTPTAESTAPRSPAGELRKIHCASPAISAADSNKSQAELENGLRDQGVRIVTGISNVQALRHFAGELQRFPNSLHQELLSQGATIHLMEGQGVTVDRTWVSQNQVTIEGTRLWQNVPGSGGSVAPRYQKTPTRIVLNNMYNHRHDDGHGHGATNLFLHEHAHMVDTLYGQHAVSGSQQWQQLSRLPEFNRVLNVICNNGYCNGRPGEAFAEYFANYHGCAEAREQLEQHAPAVAEFFRNLTSVRELRPDLARGARGSRQSGGRSFFDRIFGRD